MEFGFPKNIKLDSNSYFGMSRKIYYLKKSFVSLGTNLTFNSNGMINERGEVSISVGDDVLIGKNLVNRSNNYIYENIRIPIIDQGMTDGNIVINENSFISTNFIRLSNFQIFKGATIAAEAIFNYDVAFFLIFGGVSAKSIAMRNLIKANY